MSVWKFYTSKELKAQGWLRRQLEIQARGLAGNLDKVWHDVRDSAWIGGDAEGWERVPYWLDGFIPLAYLLDDGDMIARAQKYIDAIILGQKEDGWICPCSDDEREKYDTWAVQLISKVLTVYYECSSDERIPDVIYRALKNYYELLDSGKIRLFNWGKYRWFECFIALDFLWRRYSEEWIRSLARILKDQGAHYENMTELWKRPVNKWTYDTHIVNLAMMLKYEAVSFDLLGEAYTDSAERLFTHLKEYNGTPVGLFTGDECLSGLSAIQGTELCAVAEQMYSYEQLFAHTGDSKWAERLELLAFNALPATISDDMWSHQYVQQSNQISCVRFPGRSLFRTNGREAHLFGLEPNYGCCTANFGQAWPKLSLSSFMHAENDVISVIPLPSVLKAEICEIELETNYPFENKLTYKIRANGAFKFRVRIPSFAKRLRVNGENALSREELCFELCRGEKRTLTVEFDTSPELFDRPHDLKSVKCGSLVFSLPIEYEKKMIEYEKNGVERRFPYCDYEYLPLSDFNYAFSSPIFEIHTKELGEIPFDSHNPPLVLRAKMKRIAWGLCEGFDSVCRKTPESRTPLSDEQTLELYPYGCAKLRMTEIPLI